MRWDDVPLDERVILIRYTLSAVDNSHLVLTIPKTKTSRNWVALSDRVATALGHRARARGPVTHTAAHGGYVFHRPDGRLLHLEYVLMRRLTQRCGLPEPGGAAGVGGLAPPLPVPAGPLPTRRLSPGPAPLPRRAPAPSGACSRRAGPALRADDGNLTTGPRPVGAYTRPRPRHRSPR